MQDIEWPKFNSLTKWGKTKLIIRKCLHIFLPTFFVCVLQFSFYCSLLVIQHAEYNAGYPLFSDYIKGLDDRIPYITVFWYFIYAVITSIFWAGCFYIVYWVKGERVFWQFVRFCVFYFVVWFVIGIIFPSFDFMHDGNMQNNADIDNNHFVCWPSGHASTAYLPFMFTRKQMKKWYEYLTTILCFVIGMLIIISTLFTKQHYFMDPVITIGVLELCGVLWLFFRKKFNPFEWLFVNISGLLGIYIYQPQHDRILTFRKKYMLSKYKIAYVIISWSLFVLIVTSFTIIFLFLR